MGNVETHDLSPIRDDERKELYLARTLNYKQYCRHVEGHPCEPCLQQLPCNIRDSLSLYERMNASFNAISELPKELPLRLPHLSHLDMSHNQLVELPENFGLFLHLETLILKFNRIRLLPSSFYHLIKLKKLDISHNSIKYLPSEVVQLESLAKLNVSHNKLRVLPDSLGGIKALKVLLAGNNRFQEPFLSICDSGSDELLSHLRKNYNLQNQSSESLPTSNHNVFPRVRGNHLHTSVPNPHSAQVQYIQSQTHTANTSSRIRTPLLPPTGASSLDAFDLRDRILGLLYGAAVGDAVGLATCCMSVDECRFHYNSDIITYSDIVQDELRVRWKQGDWTSNFDTMMLLLDSIVNWAGVVDELDYARQLYAWSLKGYPELGDKHGIVLSETIKQVVENSEFLRQPHTAAQQVVDKSSIHVFPVKHSPSSRDDDECSVASTGSDESFISDIMGQGPLFPSSHPNIPSRKLGTDNGAIVTIAVLGIPNFHRCEEVEANTVRICRATHSRPVCVASCVMVAILISQLLQGHDADSTKAVQEMVGKAADIARKYITDPQELEEFNRYVTFTTVGSIGIREQYNMSYSLKAMSAGLIALQSQQSFRSFMMNLFMEGGDSNSNGCVAGALLGCKVGYSHLPPEWIQGLRKKQLSWLNVKINHFLDMMGLP